MRASANSAAIVQWDSLIRSAEFSSAATTSSVRADDIARAAQSSVRPTACPAARFMWPATEFSRVACAVAESIFTTHRRIENERATAAG